MMRIGIIGGSGYVGGELLRLLLLHPHVEVTMVTSRQSAGEYVFNIHPNLRGLTQLKFVPQDIAELQKNCDLIFAATPHGGSVSLVPQLLEVGLKVIDMSADFRLKNHSDYETYYGWKHDNHAMLKEAVYGLPELHREEIKIWPHAVTIALSTQIIGGAILTTLGLAQLFNTPFMPLLITRLPQFGIFIVLHIAVFPILVKFRYALRKSGLAPA